MYASMDPEELEELEARSQAEWDNGTFLGLEEDLPAAWVRSAILVAERRRIMSDPVSHSAGILADIVRELKDFLDDCPECEDWVCNLKLTLLRLKVDW